MKKAALFPTSHKIFSVHDIKAKAYLQPVFIKTTGEAIRTFQTECGNPASLFQQHPGDFTFVELGLWDERTATMELHSKPAIIATAAEYANIKK